MKTAHQKMDSGKRTCNEKQSIVSARGQMSDECDGDGPPKGGFWETIIHKKQTIVWELSNWLAGLSPNCRSIFPGRVPRIVPGIVRKIVENVKKIIAKTMVISFRILLQSISFPKFLIFFDFKNLGNNLESNLGSNLESNLGDQFGGPI